MRANNIAVLVGSLRKESYNRKMAKALSELAPATLKLKILEIGQLPHYNDDLDKDDPPQTWREFRESLKASDGVLFVTPEYNRSVPGVLKNAIDVASRPFGKSAFGGMPAAVISVSPGKMGGFGANHHLRQCLVPLNMPVMQQPEAYVGGAVGIFDESGALTDESTRLFAQKFINAFADWMHRLSDR